MNLGRRIAALRAIRSRLAARRLSIPMGDTHDDRLTRAIGQLDRMLDPCPVGGAMHAYLQPHGGTP